ncbi:hypothetical protein RRG08_061694 [Elysia crispata]|uniref:Uncharacterized protein n=1 Tax=Elysia crispata TaxID=231223 RepID=A0AAE0XQ23_9GAST|nr:hypothetical protein RRG08_061694 [Elysia crispata]
MIGLRPWGLVYWGHMGADSSREGKSQWCALVTRSREGKSQCCTLVTRSREGKSQCCTLVTRSRGRLPAAGGTNPDPPADGEGTQPSHDNQGRRRSDTGTLPLPHTATGSWCVETSILPVTYIDISDDQTRALRDT